MKKSRETKKEGKRRVQDLSNEMERKMEPRKETGEEGRAE